MDDLEEWKQSQEQLLEKWRKQYPPSPASKKQKKRLADPEVHERIKSHLYLVLSRFRPELEARLIQQLPLWYAANFLCLKWVVPPPEWLEVVNQKYIKWLVAREFRSKDPKQKRAVDEFFEIHEMDVPTTGRHKNAGTAAAELLEDIRTFLSYELAQLANDHFDRGIKGKDLVTLVTDHLAISPETLKARRRRAKRYFAEPQTNSDVIIFGVDFHGISKLIR